MYEARTRKQKMQYVYIYIYILIKSHQKMIFTPPLSLLSIFPRYNTNAIRDIYHLYAKAVLFVINTECLA